MHRDTTPPCQLWRV